MSVKRSDVFKVPFTGLKIPWMAVWVVYCLVTFIPGTLLWMLTLGAFRYFHLSNKVCDWTVDKSIERDGLDGY